MTTNDKPRTKNNQRLTENFNTISYINEPENKYKLNKRSHYSKKSMDFLNWQENSNVIMKIQGEIQIDLLNDLNKKKIMKCFSDNGITDSKYINKIIELFTGKKIEDIKVINEPQEDNDSVSKMSILETEGQQCKNIDQMTSDKQLLSENKALNQVDKSDISLKDQIYCTKKLIDAKTNFIKAKNEENDIKKFKKTTKNSKSSIKKECKLEINNIRTEYERFKK